MEAHLSSNCLP